MPIHTTDGGYQWGSHGKVYKSRAGAERQAAAAYAHGYKGDAPEKAASDRHADPHVLGEKDSTYHGKK